MSFRAWIVALRVCVSAVLLSRGWLTFQWDSPIRSLLWHEDWLAAPLGFFGVSWEEYALYSGPYLDVTFQIIGILLMALSLLPWLLPLGKAVNWLWVAVAILAVDSIGRWIGAGYDLGMAIEHSLQMGAPVALWLALRRPENDRFWLGFVLLASALTFVGHGLYAVGFHPVPLSYQTMTMAILGIGTDSAIVFLKVVGWLDFVAAVGIFFPMTRIPALAYMVVWGGATAAARVVSHAGFDQPLLGLDPWLAETLVRTPHWLLPLLAIFVVRGLKRGFGNAGAESVPTT